MLIRTRAPLLALTVWQPWAWAIAEGLKLVENREWSPRDARMQPGTRLVIHAGLKETSASDFRGDLAFVRENVRRIRGDQRVDGWRIPEPGSTEYVRGALVAVATYAGAVTTKAHLPPEQQGWFVGRFGWVLRDVVKLEPISCRGAQGLWPVGGEELFQVYEQLDRRGVA